MLLNLPLTFDLAAKAEASARTGGALPGPGSTGGSLVQKGPFVIDNVYQCVGVYWLRCMPSCVIRFCMGEKAEHLRIVCTCLSHMCFLSTCCRDFPMFTLQLSRNGDACGDTQCWNRCMSPCCMGETADCGMLHVILSQAKHG